MLITTSKCLNRAGMRMMGLAAAMATAGAQLGGCASEQKTFPTADAAVDSFVTALRANDQKELKQILGPQSDDLLSTGDQVADANGRATFLREYDEKHRLSEAEDGSMTLEVGPTDWPTPVPIVKDKAGWKFDTAAGIDELLSRRIGRNELDAIQVCLAIVDAEREYAAADFNGDGWREYARQFASDPGKKNGLFWKTAEGEPPSPLGELAAQASAEGYKRNTSGKPQPYHGYYYRILTQQGPAAPGGEMDYLVKDHMIGGFGVIAWPSDYGNSGLKSFITSHQGIVFEKDLGENTDNIARAMKSFNPDEGWVRCGEATR